MAEAAIPDGAVDAKGALGSADHRLALAGSLLASQVALGPCRLLDDETLARVRAMAADLAAQLTGDDPALALAVRDMLAGHRAILLHVHALAVETRLTAGLAAGRGLDPQLPPLVLRRLNGDHAAAAEAKAMLAAQSRLGQAMLRMQLPIGELPGDLQHLAHAIADAARTYDTGTHDAGAHQTSLKPVHDDGQSRLAHLHRVLAGLGDDMALALRIDDAGVALFLSALALASGQPREVVTLACAEDDPVRLALLLRAAGLSRECAATQLLAIRPEADPALVALADHALAAEALLGGQGQ